MMLIVFVENAFKHSKNNQNEKIFIDISLKIQGTSIMFFAKNSRVRSEPTSALTKKHSGFGLESVRKRLDLLYNNAHELNIRETETTYEVNLILDCK
jgi:sensor histidine kinase YesM